MNEKKLPRYQSEEGNTIRPTINNSPPITFEHPVFCFKYFHKDHSIDNCSHDEQLSFLDRMVKLSQMSWLEIQSAPKHGFGSEKIKLSSIKPSLPIKFTEDIDHLIALRFDGKKPMVGHRNKCVFHVFYLDNKFSVYSH